MSTTPTAPEAATIEDIVAAGRSYENAKKALDDAKRELRIHEENGKKKTDAVAVAQKAYDEAVYRVRAKARQLG